ncbi:MAG: hypothetical protein DRR16_12595 [Candidatus Parabeggiatoa sp. nov. 3]|nr:MAG: hypothetical protein DRR00_15180 [Gammaproteobacteria bacterium]RKZ62188.1 MAG: hypothetical protein DRQ99_19175 [Gammaproteobacteria bacterium]RKZ85216.1 MAG: hypothetical protein DRR16_12595 [Gammaproteobacteria bacterium]
MKFISQFSNTTSSPSNVLPDGEHQCAYQDMPSLFGKIQNLMTKRNISTQDCLAFECLAQIQFVTKRGQQNKFLVVPTNQWRCSNRVNWELSIKNWG